MTRTPWIQELRWPEVDAYLKGRDVVLVPVGATEQHGAHLPLMVDTGWAIAACEGAARLTDTLIAPPIHYGWSPHHMGYPGTVTLSAGTLQCLVVDVCVCLIHHGFHHVVLVNGNRIANLAPLEIAAVQLQNQTGARVAVADAGLIAKVEVKALCDASDGGLDHAGEAETSFAMHWAPEHVDLSAAGHGASGSQSTGDFSYPIELDPALNGNAVSRFSTPDDHYAATHPTGHVGDTASASAAKGEAMIEVISRNLARFVDVFVSTPVGDVRTEVPS